jgi:transglutaminase-like putative cysteine protease
VRDSYTYRKRPNVARGASGFENGYALQFFQTGVGNCYSFASAYGLLLRQVGFDIQVISGAVGRNGAPHGWVEVTVDGVTRFDDPELDMAERRKGNRRNFFNVTYGSAPFIYRK